MSFDRRVVSRSFAFIKIKASLVRDTSQTFHPTRECLSVIVIVFEKKSRAGVKASIKGFDFVQRKSERIRVRMVEC